MFDFFRKHMKLIMGLLFIPLVIGFVLFGDVPDAATVAGAGIVVAAGLYVLYRERRLKEGG